LLPELLFYSSQVCGRKQLKQVMKLLKTFTKKQDFILVLQRLMFAQLSDHSKSLLVVV